MWKHELSEYVQFSLASLFLFLQDKCGAGGGGSSPSTQARPPALTLMCSYILLDAPARLHSRDLTVMWGDTSPSDTAVSWHQSQQALGARPALSATDDTSCVMVVNAAPFVWQSALPMFFMRFFELLHVAHREERRSFYLFFFLTNSFNSCSMKILKKN